MEITQDYSVELLDKYFATAFAAPDGIKRLRELILTLAMRGKLVSQNPNDKPASELLKEIDEEKKRLIKEKKIKKSKPLPEITPDEIPYDLPNSWEWVFFDHISENSKHALKAGPFGSALKKSMYVESGFKIYGQEQVISGDENFGDYFIDNEKYKSLESCAVKPRDILISLVGTIGRTLILSDDCQAGIINPRLVKLSLYQKINRDFIKFLLSSPLIQMELSNKSHGGTMKILNLGLLRNVLLPLPPFEEQHRIVGKVDRLMEQVDRLEKLQGERDRKRLIIHTAASDRLLNAPDQNNFNKTWSFIQENFNELYCVKENISELRKAILQLAVMGKLVPQDPKDPPASEFLKEIKAEKQRLIKEKKIKKQKPLPEITIEEIPFNLPKSWELIRLDDITSKITDGDHKTPARISSGYRLLSAKNVRDGFLDFDNCDFISEENYLKSRERCLPECGDLLIVSVGGTIGRSSLVPQDSNFALVRSVALIKPILINPSYLKYSMDSTFLQDSIHSRKRGGAQPCLYLSEIRMFPFSLPPLPEQHRIVAKVDRLMALCDQLEEQSIKRTEKQSKLLEAVLAKI